MRDVSNFYEFVREERLFCATLFHLLSQRGSNLASFLDLVNSRTSEQKSGQDLVRTDRLEDAQIYVEFTYLRDAWSSIPRGEQTNKEKRAFIFEMLARVPSLSHYKSTDFPDDIAEFNAQFMGKERGSRIPKDDILNPGRWSVAALAERFGGNQKEFRDFCRFKWSFNIKPDMVVLLPYGSAVCIEAKLESKEGQYPTSNTEAGIFDGIFGKGQRRVGQLELQGFMFSTLLRKPCSFVTITRDAISQKDSTSLNWNEVFHKLDISTSTEAIKRLVSENDPLREKHS